MNKEIHTITVSEPWNFASPDGKNIIKGIILSVIDRNLLVFKANHILNFDGLKGDVFLLSPRLKTGSFDDIESKEIDINGGLFLYDYYGLDQANLQEENCKFVLIGAIGGQNKK